ncbi:MAG: coenzyme synthesis protein [Ignavibacteria bacterium]|nr:coenzyme synthesis protein [Ignavibacteria bacterium]
MEFKFNLLQHPFYQAWSDGNVSPRSLASYSDAYMAFIEGMPVFWNKIVEGLNAQSPFSDKIIKEEQYHIELWKKWSAKLTTEYERVSLDDIVARFNEMTPSELLGAIHSFEMQQPGVAQTKKEGLIKFYGFTEEELVYFDEHLNEEPHINFGKFLFEKYSKKKEFIKGFHEGAELIYHSLDRFVC